jgi:hypothetical protein
LGQAAQTHADVIAYTDGSTGTGPGGFQAGGALPINIGHEFTVTGAGIDVSSLGVFDYTTSSQTGVGGLASDHVVTLFAVSPLGTPNPGTVTTLASVDVLAGTAAPYEDGFRFASLGSPVFLKPGTYAVVAYNLTSSDPYGDPIGGNEALGLPAPGNFVTDFRYDPYVFGTIPSSPAFPNGNGSDANDHAGASFLFNPVPEPSSWVALCGLCATGLFLFARCRRQA